MLYRIGTSAFVLITIYLSSVALAESKGSIEKEIEGLKANVTAERKVLDPLVVPYLRTNDVDVRLSGGGLSRVFTALNGLTQAQRTVVARVDAINGQLAGEDHQNCPFGGHSGWYIEFNDPNYRAGADVLLSQFSATWVPGVGLTAGLQADGTAFIGMLKAVPYACIGGGVGVYGGPAGANASAHLAASLQFLGVKDGALSYYFPLRMSQLTFNFSVSCGSVGTIRVGAILPSQDANADGKVTLPLSLDGAFSIPGSDSPQAHKYHLVLGNTVVGALDNAYRVAADVSVSWSDVRR
jgi:hypothetical protein